ncbi:PhoU domain-containing protein [Ignisphaera sp. 4213-co]|uniref:PhoU domain-containing protein n=1 Tax=Ignisphaera cupida TaxID=3050454 RepID=A0ABD4Z7L1_9CREN|nr:phosphate uptake regulator PhoU [Ignisphaera sp. 4213-co]MDK6029124.1 PhoU domain-containing protein [Ignisphaera sp. 4213-co]
MAVYRRRVQRIGKSTYIVSLPNSWAKKIGLEPKMNVVMEVLPDLSLRIYVPYKQESRNVFEHVVYVDSTYSEEDVVREIIGGYVAGALTVKIVYKGIRREFIEKAVNIAKEKLMGLEVVDEDATSITLQIVVDPNLSNLTSVMKRMVRLAISMHEDIISYLNNAVDKSILDAVIARDNLVDKLYLLALRQLIAILSDPYEMGRRGLKYYDAIYMTMFLKSVERVGDHAVNISKSLQTLASQPKFITNLYTNAIEVFKSVCEAYIAPDKNTAINITKKIEELKQLEDEIRKSYGEDLAKQTAITRILDAISRIIARSIDIAEEVIDIYALKKMDKIQLATNEIE